MMIGFLVWDWEIEVRNWRYGLNLSIEIYVWDRHLRLKMRIWDWTIGLKIGTGIGIEMGIRRLKLLGQSILFSCEYWKHTT